MADDSDKRVAGEPGPAPSVPPQPAPPVPPPAPGVWRERARSRPAQLIAAGLAGALVGGGLVALLDVLDDKEERHVYVVEHRMGPHGMYPGQGRRWFRGDDDGPARPMPLPMRPRQVPPESPAPTPSG